MSKVIICRGRDITHQYDYAMKTKSVIIDTRALKEALCCNGTTMTDKLLLSIRDSIMIKSLRSKRNVVLIGEFKEIEQIERIDEILEVQGSIDDVKYKYHVKDIK